MSYGSEQIAVTRNSIFDALLAIGARLAWPSIGGPTSFKTTTRKWREASQFAAEEFPVLIQIEPTEAITPNKVGMRNRASLEVKWIAFFQTDPADPTQVGAVYLSDMMDAIENALYGDGPDGRQTLGGLVHHCYLGEDVQKAAGDDSSGKGVLAVTIHVVRP